MLRTDVNAEQTVTSVTSAVRPNLAAVLNSERHGLLLQSLENTLCIARIKTAEQVFGINLVAHTCFVTIARAHHLTCDYADNFDGYPAY